MIFTWNIDGKNYYSFTTPGWYSDEFKTKSGKTNREVSPGPDSYEKWLPDGVTPVAFIHNHPYEVKDIGYSDFSTTDENIVESMQTAGNNYDYYLLNQAGILRRRPRGDPNEVGEAITIAEGFLQGDVKVKKEQFDYGDGNTSKRLGPVGNWGNLKPKRK